jgi:hypothetical protein
MLLVDVPADVRVVVQIDGVVPTQEVALDIRMVRVDAGVGHTGHRSGARVAERCRIFVRHQEPVEPV